MIATLARGSIRRPDVDAALGAVATVRGEQAPWVVRRRLARCGDLVVVAAGPAGGPERAIVKVASGGRARRQLAREWEMLRALHATGSLGRWLRLVPAPLAFGETGSCLYTAVAASPGVNALRLLRGLPGVVRTVADAFAPLRSAAVPARVGEAELERWVAEPARLVAAVPAVARDPLLVAAVRRLEAELRDVLAGRLLPVGLAHGDCWLGNVLVTADGEAATAILDWETAADGEPALLDGVHLLLTTRALRRRSELGSVVRDAARWSWDDDERALVDDAGVPAGALVRFAWLRHVANNLSKRDTYSTRRIWLRHNVVAVLESRMR
ncbi:MAG TPA: aminoglycoside phosphotransferase family protein [Gaiellaceae bacterium]